MAQPDKQYSCDLADVECEEWTRPARGGSMPTDGSVRLSDMQLQRCSVLGHQILQSWPICAQHANQAARIQLSQWLATPIIKASPSCTCRASRRMANSKYEYVKSYELDDKLLPGCFIVVRIDGKGFTK
jgi:hypothetical protein